MTFCVFADLHYDAIPDGDRRIRTLLEVCKSKSVDFILELGDLCRPTEENKKVMKQLRGAGVPCYFTLGNHNVDKCTTEEALRFLGLKKGHYSIRQGNVKFLFLDANYVKTECGCFPVCGTDAVFPAGGYPYIPPEQIAWLRDELAEEGCFYVICSHQSLFNEFAAGDRARGIINREEVRYVLERRNQLKKCILFCINGHDHGDAMEQINGISYYSLNAASYIWHGTKPIYAYGTEIHNRYPALKHMILYEEPLHVIISIDGQGEVEIEGMRTHYQSVTPEEAGIGATWNGVSILPRASSLHIAAP